MKKVNVQNAIGQALCHDITAMFDGFKGALFKRGHVICEEDIPKLLDIGKQHVFIWEDNAGDNQFNLWIGVAYAINEAMAVDGKIKMRSGDIDGDATHFDVNFSYNF